MRRRFRHVAIRCILATDLACANEFTAPFEQELKNVPVPLDEQEIQRQGDLWTSDKSSAREKRRSSDTEPLLGFTTEPGRLLLASMIVKVSDVSHAARRWDVHIEWTERIQMEFAAQGARERQLHLPVSPLCDTDEVQPKAQLGFIDFVVRPCLLPLAQLCYTDDNGSNLVAQVRSRRSLSFAACR